MNKNIVNGNSNERMHDLTADEVRQFDQYKSYTDEQVDALIQTIKAYTLCIYNICCKKKKNGKLIALSIKDHKLNAA